MRIPNTVPNIGPNAPDTLVIFSNTCNNPVKAATTAFTAPSSKNSTENASHSVFNTFNRPAMDCLYFSFSLSAEPSEFKAVS